MLLLCLLHAIFTQFVLNNFFLHLYLRLCNQKISTKLCLVQYPFSNVKYSCHSTQNSKALKKKKKETRQKNSYYTVTEMLKGQTVHQSISLYPTIVSNFQGLCNLEYFKGLVSGYKNKYRIQIHISIIFRPIAFP